MNCAEAKRYVAFTRDGELSPEEERRLAEHLRVCPACAAERASFLEQDRSLKKLRSIVPDLRDPEANVQTILHRIRSENAPGRQSVVSAIIDRLIRALEVPGLRYALAVFVTVTVTGFVFQQVTILRSVSALEVRLSQPEAQRFRTVYTVPPGGLQRLAQSPDLRKLLERAEARQMAGHGRYDANRVGLIAQVLDSPESRWMLQTLLPGAQKKEIDSLVSDLTRNVHRVWTYSKGDAE